MFAKVLIFKKNIMKIYLKTYKRRVIIYLNTILLFLSSISYNCNSIATKNLNSKLINKKDNLKNHQIVKYIERPISNAKNNQFISNIQDQSTILAPIYKDIHDYNYMSFLYSTKEDNFWFVPQRFQENAKSILVESSFNNLRDLNIVPINNKQNYNILCSKYSPVFGGDKSFKLHSKIHLLKKDIKTKSTSKDTLDVFFNNENYENYISVADYNVLKKAIEIEAQYEKWTCGPNSSLRAITILAQRLLWNYETWKKHCPKYICKETTKQKSANVATGGFFTALLGIATAPLTGGISIPIILGGQAAFVCGSASYVVAKDSKQFDVGPSLGMLASYMNSSLKSMKGYRSKVFRYGLFSECDKKIKEYILKGFPVIPLLIFSVEDMHYVTIIGIELDKNERTKNYIILNTDKKLYRMSYNEMRECMYNSVPFVTGLLATILKHYGLDNYNLITLENSNPQKRYTHQINNILPVVCFIVIIKAYISSKHKNIDIKSWKEKDYRHWFKANENDIIDFIKNY